MLEFSMHPPCNNLLLDEAHLEPQHEIVRHLWDFKAVSELQSGLVEDVPVHDKRLEPEGLQGPLPTQTILWFLLSQLDECFFNSPWLRLFHSPLLLKIWHRKIRQLYKCGSSIIDACYDSCAINEQSKGFAFLVGYSPTWTIQKCHFISMK